ncbi:N-acetylmuramic acid 6-phosphate etherase [Phaeovulum sp.]|uniref:N-acetylmuramic acid 6-phosphate etherase n=1 Tax=Phaeovulum sp. TaxID=2934796 RepID=UPI0039E4E0E6
MTTRRTEESHPLAAGLDALTGTAAVTQLFEAQAASLAAIRPALPALEDVATMAADALRQGHRLIYAGAGSAGLMALADCLELAGTFGLPPDRTPILFAGGTDALVHMKGQVEDDPASARADLAKVAPKVGDLVICVSASGSTPYTMAVARAARAVGAKVAGLANNADAPLLTECDLPVLLDTGPEMLAGSTRMAAATAQKVALNVISTRAAMLLGHIHAGRMVNLQAENAKLMERATGIVADLADRTKAEAVAALDAAGGAVKPAVLIAAGASMEQAQGLLTASGGQLGPALAALKT